MSATPGSLSISLYKGGPTLFDLIVDVPEMRITVTGPKMLFDRLVVLTTLSVFEGQTVLRLHELAKSLEGTIHCGRIGIRNAEIAVESFRAGGVLYIDLGPPSMYQSEIVLRTRTGETFRSLVTRLFASDSTQPFFAGLHGVPATGHLEHHHSDNDTDSGSGNGGVMGHEDHDHDHHGGPHGHP